MDWIHRYQLFLFDFDGVLVDTEKLHLRAYQKMCSNRGFSLNWDEYQYAKIATFSANGLKEALHREFPQLFEQVSSWDVLYQEKKQAYLDILENETIALMPGVGELLLLLQDKNIPRCVVTHSSADQVARIQQKNPLLQSIPNWVTREHYSAPKPHPECYQKAVAKFARPGDRIVGFEDSPRGLQALTATSAEAFLVTSLMESSAVEELAKEINRPFRHVPSLLQIN